MFKKLKLKGQSLAGRVTGFSSPIVGLNWTPPVDEQDKARRLLVFLEDRRALYQPHEREISHHVVRSVLQIRQRLTRDLEEIPKESPLGESLTAMRASCRKFLDETSHGHSDHFGSWGMSQHLMLCLGELRALFGIHIAKIAFIYDLEIEGELISIIPPDPCASDQE